MRAYIVVILICLLSQFVLGQESDYVVKVSELSDIKVPCTKNNSYCSGSATCNISIIAPNQSILISDKLMTNQKAYHNYSITFNETGRHSAIVFCQDGVYGGNENYRIDVNNLGNTNENLTYIVIGVLALFTLFSVILTIFFYQNDSWLRYGFLILDFLFPTLLCYYLYLFPVGTSTHAGDLFVVLAIVMGSLTFILIMLVLLELSAYIITKLRQSDDDEWRYF